MVGNRNSGRKAEANSNDVRYKKRSFYVKEYYSHQKDKWIEDPTFTWFRKHHGARWQDQIRTWMRQDVIAWREKSHWRCACDSDLHGNYRHINIHKCYSCKTWKNEATRRAYEGQGPGGR